MSLNSTFEHYVRYRFGNHTEFEVPNRYINLDIKEMGCKGVICSAFDIVTKKQVAIKKRSRALDGIFPSMVLFRDIKLLRTVKHKNVINLIHAFTPHCSLKEFQDVYLVTELMDVNLCQLLRRKLDLKRMSYLMYQLLCGVKYLHSIGLILRDLKPSNVAVSSDCSLKILSFGLLRSVKTAFVRTPFAVTRNYRAPEVIFGMEFKENVDVWSVGCIMGELLRGSVIFSGGDHVEIWDSIVQQLGTPSETFMAKIEPDVRSYIESQAKHVGRPFEEIFPDEGFSVQQHWYFSRMQARDFLFKMLVIDPEHRITIDQVLDHSFIGTWYLQDEVNPVGLRSGKFNVDDLNYTAQQWKRLIYQEVMEYEEISDLATFGVAFHHRI